MESNPGLPVIEPGPRVEDYGSIAQKTAVFETSLQDFKKKIANYEKAHVADNTHLKEKNEIYCEMIKIQREHYSEMVKAKDEIIKSKSETIECLQKSQKLRKTSK